MKSAADRLVVFVLAALAAVLPRPAAAQVRYLEGHQRPIQAVVYSPDGKQIITGSADRTIKIWDRASGKIVRSITAGDVPVMAVAITRDGRRLYAADFAGTVRMYEVPRPHPLPETLAISRPPTAFTLLADHALMAAGDANGSVRLWNLAMPTPPARDFQGPTGEVVALAIGDKAAAGPPRLPADRDKNVEVFAALADGSLVGWKTDAAGGAVNQVIGPVLTPRLGALAVSRDGTVVGGGEDGLLRIFNWPPAPPVNFTQHTSSVNAIVLSPDGKVFASGGADQKVHLTEAASGKPIRTLDGQYNLFGQSIQVGAVEGIAFSQDGRLVAAGGAAGQVRLWNADGTDRSSLGGHTGAVHGVAVHPEGNQVASAGADGTIRIWDLPARPVNIAPPSQPIQAFALSADGKTVFAALADKTVQSWAMPEMKSDAAAKPAAPAPQAKPLRIELPVPATAVAVARTGLRLATGDAGGLLRLADPKDGKIQATLGAHTGQITALGFHPDSSLLLSAGQDGILKLWDMAAPSPARLAESKKPMAAVAISSDGKFAVSGGADGGIRQFDCATGRPIRALVEPGTIPPGSPGAVPAVTALALTADNSLLAAAGDNGTIRFWTTADGAPKSSLQGHTGAIQGLAFSPKGDQIASCGADGTVRLWRLPLAPAVLADMVVPADKKKPVQALAISPDGRLAMLCGEGGEVRLWNLVDGKTQIELKGQTAVVNRAVFRPDGGEVATADAAGNIRFWSTADGSRQDLVAAHEGAVTSLAYLPGGKQLVSGGSDGLLRLWQLPLPPPAKPTEGPVAKASAMLMSAGAKTVAWGAADGTVTLVDRAGGKTAASVKGRGNPAAAIALSSDETLVAIGDEDGTVRVALAAAGQEPLALPGGHKGRVNALAFHPKGALLASASADGTVRLWRVHVIRKALTDPAARTQLLAPKVEKPPAPKPGTPPPPEVEEALAQIVPVSSPVSSMTFTPDGSRMFCGAADKNIRFWNADQLAVKGQPNPPGPSVWNHTGAVTCLAFSQNGQTLLAGGADNILRVWNAQNGQVLVELKHTSPVRSVSASTDGTRVATVTEDGTIRVWNPKSLKVLERLAEKSGPVLGMTFLPDNKTVLAGDAAGALRQYTISAQNLLTADPGKVNVLALLPDGKSLATGGDDGIIKLWEIAQLAAGPSEPNNAPQPKQRFEPGSKRAPVVAMAMRGDGRLAAAVSGEGLFLQNMALSGGQGSAVFVPLPPAGSPPPKGGPIVIKDLAFSPDGLRLAVVVGDDQVRFYNSADGRKLEDLPLAAATSCVTFPGKENRLIAAAADGRLYACQPSLVWADPGPGTAVTSVAHAPDGTTVIAGGTDGTIRLIKAADGSPIKTIPSAGGSITCLTVTPDGTRAITGNTDQNVRIFQLSNHQAVLGLVHGSPVRAIALGRDGRRLISATDDREFPIRAWDLASGKELQRAGGIAGPVLSLAVAADSKTCIAGSADGSAWLRTLEVRQAIVAESGQVLAAAFSADGKTLASCGNTPGVKLWDAEGKLLRTFTDPKTVKTPSEPTFRLIAVSADGRFVAGADHAPGPGNRALVWDAADGKLLHTVAGQVPVTCLAFSADGRKLAVGTSDQQFQVLRTSDGLLLEKFTVPTATTIAAFAPDNVTLAAAAGNTAIAMRTSLLRVLIGHQGDVTAVHYTPGGKSLLTSGADKTIRLWDAQEGKQTAAMVPGSAAITALALSRDGRRFVTGDPDKTARVWELNQLAAGPAGTKDQKPLAAFVHAKAIRGLSISGNGARVATGCEDGLTRIWDTATGKELERVAGTAGNVVSVALNAEATAVVTGGANGAVSRASCSVARAIEAHRGAIRGLRFGPDGSLYSASEDKSLVQWSAKEWKALWRYEGAAEPIRAMVLSPCGRFVTAGDGPRVRLWNAADGRLLATVETPAAVAGLDLDEGGKKLLVAGGDKIIRNYAILHAEGKCSVSLTHQTLESAKAIMGLALAPDGSTLYSLCADTTVPRWFMAAGPVRTSWAAHEGPIYSLRMAPDDARLVTAGADRAARIWNAADGKLVRAMAEHGDRVMDAAFTADGKQVATCGLDKTLRIFDDAGKLAKSVSEGLDGGLYSLAMAVNNQFGQVILAAAGPAQTVQWWNPAVTPPLRAFPGHNDAIYRVLFSPTGSRLLSLDYSGGLLIWDASGNVSHWQQLPLTAAYTMACAPEDRELAVAAHDGRLLIITLPSGVW